MLNGLIVLGGLCFSVIYGAKLAVQNKEQPSMDFYEFYDLEKPQPKSKFRLRLIKGGKSAPK